MPAAETKIESNGYHNTCSSTSSSLLCLVMLPFPHPWLHPSEIFPSQASAGPPPDPRPLPIIGNLLEFGDKPQQSLTTLSKTYGPLMSLKLGSSTTIVISSPETAQQVLINQKRPSLFWQDSPQCLPSSQPSPFFNGIFTSIGSLGQPQEDLQNEDIFPFDAFHGLRRKVVQQLLDHAHESCSSGQAVDLGRAAFTTALNMLSNTFFSVDLAHYDSNLSQGFKDLVQSLMVESEKPNLADFFPDLRLVYPQGIQRRLTVLLINW